MPLLNTVNNNVTDPAVIYGALLPYLKQELGFMANRIPTYVNRFTVTGDKMVLKDADGKVIIEFELTKVAGRGPRPRTVSADPNCYKRLIVRNVGIPAEMHEDYGVRSETTFKIHATELATIDSNSVLTQVSNFIKIYEKFLPVYSEQQSAILAVEREVKEQEKRIDNRRKLQAEVNDKREANFEALVNAVGESGKITTKLDGQYINLMLPNKLNIRLGADHEGFRVIDVEIPQEKANQLDAIKATVAKLAGV